MTCLADPIRIETETFPVHQVSHKIPLMLEVSQMVRVIRQAPLPISLPSSLFGLLEAAGVPKNTGTGDYGLNSQWSVLIINRRERTGLRCYKHLKMMWVSTEIRRSDICKKGCEIDGFRTIGNLLRGKRKFGKREINGQRIDVQEQDPRGWYCQQNGILVDQECDLSHELADVHAGSMIENAGAQRTK